MEITQNTLLKLIVRQGTNTERQYIVLDSGELGYTNDSERLFIGNGSTNGGKIVGNLFHGETTDPTTVAYPEINDLVFDLDKNKLFYLKFSTHNNLSSWSPIAAIYQTGDDYITISDSNIITLNPLSSYSVDSDLLSFPLYLDSGKISLSSVITNASARYDALSGNTLVFSKNITAYEKISAGHYKLTYTPFENDEVIVTPTILGLDGPGCYLRTISVSNSSCQIKVLSGAGQSYSNDVNISVTITN